jgi:drug/metabolite transporter (DMT)-like permease
MWFPLAIGAAAPWGVDYAFSEHVYKYISVMSALAIGYVVAAAVMVSIALATGVLPKDIHTLATSHHALLVFGVATVAFIAGSVLLGFSIEDKNATITSLIEISYPLFIVLFSYIFFRENNLNAGTALGGALVFLGVATIYIFNR